MYTVLCTSPLKVREGLNHTWTKVFRYTRYAMFYNEIVPRVSEVDYLTVMGGPMNMEDENKYPLAG